MTSTARPYSREAFGGAGRGSRVWSTVARKRSGVARRTASRGSGTSSTRSLVIRASRRSRGSSSTAASANSIAAEHDRVEVVGVREQDLRRRRPPRRRARHARLAFAAALEAPLALPAGACCGRGRRRVPTLELDQPACPRRRRPRSRPAGPAARRPRGRGARGRAAPRARTTPARRSDRPAAGRAARRRRSRRPRR